MAINIVEKDIGDKGTHMVEVFYNNRPVMAQINCKGLLVATVDEVIEMLKAIFGEERMIFNPETRNLTICFGD